MTFFETQIVQFSISCCENLSLRRLCSEYYSRFKVSSTKTAWVALMCVTGTNIILILFCFKHEKLPLVFKMV
jgi:hypothetical protein